MVLSQQFLFPGGASGMDDIVLEARNLGYRYAGSDELCQRCEGHRSAAVDGINLKIAHGQRLAILGANGAGKSTLLLLLNGTLRPSSGDLLLDGRPADYSRSGLLLWRQRVGLVFQDPDDQLFAANVFQDVSFGPLNLGLPQLEAHDRTNEALATIGIADLSDSPIHMLSGGQRKLAALAGVFAMHPQVFILDEPTAGLDALSSSHLLAFLNRLNACGSTVILAMHDTDLALDWANDVAVLSHGQIVRHGPPQIILSDEEFMAESHLRMPWVLRCWHQASLQYGTSNIGKPPRAIDQLIEQLQCAVEVKECRR
jgi:cobalt/nickel transport system ATP-binding protein